MVASICLHGWLYDPKHDVSFLPAAESVIWALGSRKGERPDQNHPKVRGEITTT